MPLTLTAADLPNIATGASFCGSGGGGAPRITELLVREPFQQPITVFESRELPPDTQCFAPAFAGSTLLLGERLTQFDAFMPLIAVATRWIGGPIDAVCSLEAGGLNALTPFLFAGSHTIVDADCSGRAVPTVDRTSLYVDRVPGVFAVCSTGGGGVAIVQSERADDVDRLMRAALIQAGGAGPVLFAGFTTGDLERHALHGHLRRSRSIGEALAATANAPIEALVAQIGATLIGHGRVLELAQVAAEQPQHTAEIAGSDGAVLRVVSCSEYLAVLADGRPVAASPDYIVAIDMRTRELVEVTMLRPNRHIGLITLPADPWWREAPHRAKKLFPSSYGIDGLDPAW